jgi:hypothetical protein
MGELNVYLLLVPVVRIWYYWYWYIFLLDLPTMMHGWYALISATIHILLVRVPQETFHARMVPGGLLWDKKYRVNLRCASTKKIIIIIIITTTTVPGTERQRRVKSPINSPFRRRHSKTCDNKSGHTVPAL